MTYTVSELGVVEAKTFTSLASALRRVATMVAKNEREGESSYIYVRQHCVGHVNDGRAIVEIHCVGRNAEAHTAKVLAEASAQMARETCTFCDGDGFAADYITSCKRCGGSGKELR